MKIVFSLLACFFMLSPNVLMSETLGKLVKRDGIYYKSFTEIPYSGKVTGRTRGSLKNGRKHGPWVFYFENGRLSKKGTYNNGKKEGLWTWFNKSGPVLGPFTEKYKNDNIVSD